MNRENVNKGEDTERQDYDNDGIPKSQEGDAIRSRLGDIILVPGG